MEQLKLTLFLTYFGGQSLPLVSSMAHEIVGEKVGACFSFMGWVHSIKSTHSLRRHTTLRGCRASSRDKAGRGVPLPTVKSLVAKNNVNELLPFIGWVSQS
jgi:hypothetical protein